MISNGYTSITLKDILGKNETTKDLKIIMQLNNNYDFKIDIWSLGCIFA